jgi:KUP system potassium uptake protein
MGALALAALGVVYGDIGTSPLYTLKECMSGEHGVAATPENLLGVLSLIFWSLTLVVTVKYLTFIMRADNRGEGGILALLALIPEKFGGGRGRRHAGVSFIALLVIIGASLLYGDGVITPAISVLGAVEGLEVATTSLKPAVVPLTCVILVGLFAIQSRGTGSVGKLFGPVMLLWFGTLSVLGSIQIAKNPAVLFALSPHHALHLFASHGFHGFKLLGSVVLAVTGGEALYADMGHFGAKPIRVAWLAIVWPALILAYFGQGALLLAHPEAAANPFYEMVPKGFATYALVGLATMAAVIASQALISGAFSLTHQAVQLGFFPRVRVKHTSSETEGQIYIPEINWGLALACIVLVLVFKGSSALAAAYGIAVSGTMGITSVVYFLVTRQTWKWSISRALPLLVFFLVIDIAFFSANALKFFDGGYVPIFIGAAAAVVMITWKTGRALLGEYFVANLVPLESFLANLEAHVASRVPGAAVFMASNPKGAPPVMVHHAKRIKVLHETVVLLSVVFEHVPSVSRAERLKVEELGKGFYRVVARYGFMQTPDVPELLAEAVAVARLPVELREVTYYLGRETFLATGNGKMGKWSEHLFSFLSKNARTATKYFGLPAEQVVEIGTQIDL